MAGTGYVSVTDYLNANQGTLDRERAALQQYVGGEQGTATNQADALIQNAVPGQGDYTSMPGYSTALDSATKANTDTAALGTEGGVSTLLQRMYGGTQDAANFDAGLLGGQQTQNPNDLTAYLNGGLGFASEQPGPQNQHGARDRGPQRTPIGAPDESGPSGGTADPTPWIDPNHTDPNGGPSYIDPWQGTGGG